MVVVVVVVVAAAAAAAAAAVLRRARTRTGASGRHRLLRGGFRPLSLKQKTKINESTKQ